MKCLNGKLKALFSLLLVLLIAATGTLYYLTGIQWYQHGNGGDDMFYYSANNDDNAENTFEDISLSGKTIVQTFTIDEPFNYFYIDEYDTFELTRIDDTSEYVDQPTYEITLTDENGNVIDDDGYIDSLNYYYNNDGQPHTYTITIKPTNIGAKSRYLFRKNDTAENPNNVLTVGGESVDGELAFAVANLDLKHVPLLKKNLTYYILIVEICLVPIWILYLIISPIVKSVKKRKTE